MPNIASILKGEISRIARKEGRSETEPLRKAVSAQRADIVVLKRRIQELEKALNDLAKAVARSHASKASSSQATQDEDASAFRFRAAGMASNRKRLGLTAEQFGRLVGASGQSVYAWESGKSQPRAKNLAAIAALRGAGKRNVAARLEALQQAS